MRGTQKTTEKKNMPCNPITLKIITVDISLFFLPDILQRIYAQK